eukprot:g11412.t1
MEKLIAGFQDMRAVLDMKSEGYRQGGNASREAKTQAAPVEDGFCQWLAQIPGTEPTPARSEGAPVAGATRGARRPSSGGLVSLPEHCSRKLPKRRRFLRSQCENELMDAASQRTPPPATAVTAVVGLMHGLAVHPALHGRAGRAACPGGRFKQRALRGTAVLAQRGEGDGLVAPGTYAKTWSNPSGAVLRCCVPGSLWAAERPFVWNSIDVGGKMAVIRLPSGALWVHSPVELDVHLRAQLAELGPVQHVVSPNFEHVKYAKQWKEAYPEATLWGSPGMIEKFPKIPYDRELDIASPAAWQGDIEICFADCERRSAEPTSAYPEAMPEGSKLWKFLMDKIYLPFYRRFMLKDEASLESVLKKVKSWQPKGRPMPEGDVANGHEGGEELPSSILDVIEADVARTFPNDDKFQEGQKGEMGGPDHLRLVLVELARQDMELGYCQSLNFIAANFLMVLHTPEMAVSAVRQLIMKLQTRQWYMEGMRQLRADTAVLEEMLRERLPAVHQVLVQHQFDFLFVTSKWFLCLFAATLSDEVLRRVWDVLLVDGIEAVFRVSLSLFALHQKAILQVKSQDDLIHMMQEWQPNCSPEVLIQKAYCPTFVGPIGRLDLDQRRRRSADATLGRSGHSARAPENTIESVRYCLELKVPLLQLDVILFHDVPLERNMEKLMGVTGQIHDFNYDELPPFKQLLQPNAFCPEDAFPVAVKELKVSLFEDACRLLAGTGTQIILEFWQESEELILSVLELLKRHQLLNQIAAWGSPEKLGLAGRL